MRRHAHPADFAVYDARAAIAALEGDALFRWCPRGGCGAGQLAARGTAEPRVTCARCGEAFCFTHRVRWHRGLTCAEYDAADTEHAADVRDEEERLEKEAEARRSQLRQQREAAAGAGPAATRRRPVVATVTAAVSGAAELDGNVLVQTPIRATTTATGAATARRDDALWRRATVQRERRDAEAQRREKDHERARASQRRQREEQQRAIETEKRRVEEEERARQARHWQWKEEEQARLARQRQWDEQERARMARDAERRQRRDRKQQERSSEQYVRANMKPCTGCGWWTQRIDGCKHITCKAPLVVLDPTLVTAYYAPVNTYQLVLTLYHDSCKLGTKCGAHWCWKCGRPWQIGHLSIAC